MNDSFLIQEVGEEWKSLFLGKTRQLKEPKIHFIAKLINTEQNT